MTFQGRTPAICSSVTHCGWCAEDLSALTGAINDIRLCSVCGQPCQVRAEAVLDKDFWIWRLGQGPNAAQSFELRQRQTKIISETQLRVLIAKRDLLEPSAVSDTQMREAIKELNRRFGSVQIETDQAGRCSRPKDELRLVDPKFWRYTSKRFANFASRHAELTYTWNCFVYEDQELDAWNAGPFILPLRNSVEEVRLRERFVCLARRAVRRLGLETGDDIRDRNVWLNLLRRKYGLQTDASHAMVPLPLGLEKVTGFPSLNVIQGSMLDVLARSKKLCDWVAATSEVGR